MSWRLRADGKPQADLARAFGDRDEHDVHDADAADDQRHRRDRAQQNRHHLRRRLLGGEHLGQVADREVVLRARAGCGAARAAAPPSPESPGPWPAGSRPAPSPSRRPWRWPCWRRGPSAWRSRSAAGSRRPDPGRSATGPLGVSTPATVNGTFLMMTTCPVGSLSPNRLLRDGLAEHRRLGGRIHVLRR